ncbi:MAG: acetolactate synthase small subunit [Pseudomonadota bacterium]|jgi:acetolactate synthase-1/3 small subunit|nr:acetolactate synthase small subunit [SAR86 cluster bacterium]MEC7268652.1 acetolactate synthase small subunit [Pseudomonadota bacterium]MEC7787536.1 acetolactate synthase small subunit [Pseudomonadota bacterium]MEC8377992.1 acetolactate synthase small subunit [Pseudomonadota bacterium]MEC9193685.1 acetolactate synthase small subunit [Pseudomonadota bacterium]|tara:strand:- start:649 stop:1161 length:513 start_codon:yes stop_codon:yes gene_type:complete
MASQISLLMENQPGALSRVIGLFSQRGYNIDSLSVAPTQDPTLSRLTMTTSESVEIIQQILKQLFKLIDVVMVQDLKASESISLEMALIKVSNKAEVISKIEKNYSSLDLNELDNTDEKTILRLIGETDILESLLVELKDDLVEVTRTGALGMTLGNISLETEEETKVIY